MRKQLLRFAWREAKHTLKLLWDYSGVFGPIAYMFAWLGYCLAILLWPKQVLCVILSWQEQFPLTTQATQATKPDDTDYEDFGITTW